MSIRDLVEKADAMLEAGDFTDVSPDLLRDLKELGHLFLNLHATATKAKRIATGPNRYS